jgi:hypothetical protein
MWDRKRAEKRRFGRLRAAAAPPEASVRMAEVTMVADKEYPPLARTSAK